MRRKRIYRIGVVVIIILVLQYPVSLLIFGKKVNGVVVEAVYNGNYLDLISGASSIPQVIFHYKDSLYTIQGIKDQKLEPGERVTVVFFSWNPAKAKIMLFSNLFLLSTIELPLGLLIWWALFKSFPNLYNTTISKKQYAKLLINGRLRKEKPILRSAPRYLKVLLVIGMTVTALIFAYLIWNTISSMIVGKLDLQLGAGICLILVFLLLSLFQKMINE